MRVWTQQYEETFSSSASRLVFQPARFIPAQSSPVQTAAAKVNLQYYLGLYFLLSLLVAAVGSLRFFLVMKGSIKASRTLFNKLSNTVLRTPLRWIDTVPQGRVINRFTSDFVSLDSKLSGSTCRVISHILRLLGVIVSW